MRTQRVAFRFAVAAASWAAATIACSAATVVGSATSTKPGVFRNSAGTTITLSPGAPVEADDLVNTDREGRGKLRFLDGSNLDIGPGSEVKIDKFVYNPNRSKVAGAVIGLFRGVLRFVSKGAPDRAYQFRTATSTIGIRGTDFGLAFNPATVETTVQTFEGAVEVCARSCALLKGSGGVNTAIIDANGNVQTFNRSQPSGDKTLTFGMQAGVVNPDGTSAIVTASIGAGSPIAEAALVIGAGTGIAAVDLALSGLLSGATLVPPVPSPISQ